MEDNFDFPHFDLVQIESELGMLKEYRELLEQHFIYSVEQNETAREAKLRAYDLTPSDPEWITINQESDFTAELMLPRLFRGPFVVALWGVYESSVLALARLLKRRQDQGLSIEDLEGGFLKCAKKYFNHVLHFKLCDNDTWARLNDLYKLRNAIAHANGHMDMVKDRSTVEKLVDRRKGLSISWNYVLMTKEFLEGEHKLIESNVSDMLNRYKSLKTKK